MDRGSVDIIESWDSRPLSEGLEGLISLEQSEFTGAASAAGAWLFMLNGNVIGVFDGDIDSFREASGTVYQSPDPSIVLLFAMQEYGGETQAQYFTDDTPIREVHSTLTDSSFTGYLKLSENVISGDYFVLYYGGRSMNVAIVGNAQRVVTGDEAFELATEEVGIYEVISVDVSVVDLPTPEETAGAPEESDSDDSIDPEEEPTDTEEEPAQSTTESTSPDQRTTPEESSEQVEEPPEPDPTPEPSNESSVPVAEAEPTESSSDSDQTQEESPEDTGTSDRDFEEPSVDESAVDRPSTQKQPPQPGPAGENNDRFSEEEEWRKTRTIPALDPDDSSIQSERTTDTASTQPTQEPRQPPANDNTPEQSHQLSEVEERIQHQQQKIDSLAEKVEELEDERNKLETERNELQSELQRQETSSSGTGHSSHAVSFSPDEALEQTDLFIRYNSKGDATLEDVRYGDIDEEALASNLNLETHTRFSIDDAVVDDQPFREFLNNRIEYQFVKWVTAELPFEIRNTGNEAPLKELYHLLPRIDRVELNGQLDGTNADEEEITRSFDVIIRDRMGEPLIVANINHERDPADASMMEQLTDDASDVSLSHEKLGGAFLVTASFFTPEALETAAKATGGGFLSRDKRKNYVKLSRKNGFHLCLIEARENAFHITSPEL